MIQYFNKFLVYVKLPHMTNICIGRTSVCRGGWAFVIVCCECFRTPKQASHPNRPREETFTFLSYYYSMIKFLITLLIFSAFLSIRFFKYIFYVIAQKFTFVYIIHFSRFTNTVPVSVRGHNSSNVNENHYE